MDRKKTEDKYAQKTIKRTNMPRKQLKGQICPENN